MQCVVLDGWHKGHVVMLPDAPPTIRLYQPKVVTWCECSESLDATASDPTAREYKLAFRATDGEVACYSVKGDSGALLSGRDWIAGIRGLLASPKPLYWNEVLDVDCRDERAFG